MKRIFHLWFVCGSLDLPETYLAAALARKGFRMTVVHSSAFRPEREAVLREAGIELVPMAIRNRLDFAASRRLHAELAHRPCDIIYAPQNKALAMALQAVHGHPDIHVIGYRGTCGHLMRWDPSSWLTYFNPRLDHVVAVSKAVRRYLVDQIRLPAGKVTQIYKGHDPAWYDVPERPAREPSSPETPLTLCFTGRIRPVKGVIYLLDALRLLPKELNVRLLLVGTMADKKVEKRLQRDKDPRVIVLGERKDIPAILAQTDIFLMPTIKREGLARSVLEAMSQRIPCIVSDVGGLPELIVDGETGLVVPPCDPEAIARAVERLAGDKALREKFGKAARKRVEESFNVNGTIIAFQKLFSDICAKPRCR